MIKVVREEDAQFIAHGATGKGNDQIRFELSSYALHPKIKVRHVVLISYSREMLLNLIVFMSLSCVVSWDRCGT